MALALGTSNGHTASTSTAAAATMLASSPPSPAQPPCPANPWGPDTSCRACLSDLAAVLLVLVCFSFVGVCLHCAARFLARCLYRRRAAREALQEAQEPPKPPSDADVTPPVAAAGVWAEAECAICLAELIDPEGGERVRVLPACGHGFHAACVEAWFATRASCPTCRAPSRSRTPRTTRGQPSRTRQAAA